MEQKPRGQKHLLPAFIVGITVSVLVCSGCTANRKAGTPTPAPATSTIRASTAAPPMAARATPVPAPSAVRSPVPRATLAPGDHLYVRSGLLNNALPGLALLNGTSGARERNLLLGAVSPDWSVLYAVDIQNGATRLLARDPLADPGTPPLRERLIQGEYQLLGLGLDGAPGGISPNGEWLTLAGRPPEQTTGGFRGAGGASDRFVVADTAFTGTVRGVILNGLYRFYALSNDGNALYLLENGPQEQGRFRSQIRLYDLRRGRLAERPLSDQKGSTVMLSGRQFSVTSPDGTWLYMEDGVGS